jgi:hypothetical protein
MQHKHLLVSTISVLAVVMGLAAYNSKPPELPAVPKMSNDELDRSVTAKINSDPALLAYKLDVDADADKNAVTISGTVPTESLRMKAVDAAKTVVAGLVATDKIDVDATATTIDTVAPAQLPSVAPTAYTYVPIG